MKVFSDYASYYNLLYKNKDYATECKYVESLILKFQKQKSKTLLDIGCGTGRHASHFTKLGFDVVGIDQSAEMIQIAKESKISAEFFHANATSFNLERKFDVISSLFHVASYQTSNANLNAYFVNIEKHLHKDGIFIFDCWYGPAVLTDPPVVRVKRLEDETVKVTRISEPILCANENRVDVEFQVLIKNKKTEMVTEIVESHSMRYLFYPEIISLLESNGLKLMATEEWMNGGPISEKTWYACFIGGKA